MNRDLIIFDKIFLKHFLQILYLRLNSYKIPMFTYRVTLPVRYSCITANFDS